MQQQAERITDQRNQQQLRLLRNSPTEHAKAVTAEIVSDGTTRSWEIVIEGLDTGTGVFTVTG